MLNRIKLEDLIAPSLRAHKQALANSKGALTREKKREAQAASRNRKKQEAEEMAALCLRMAQENERRIETCCAELEWLHGQAGDLRESIAQASANAEDVGLDVRVRWGHARAAKRMDAKLAMVMLSIRQAGEELAMLQDCTP